MIRGDFFIPNVPFNPYHLMVTAAGFSSYVHDIEVRSSVPINLTINLTMQTSETVTVESGAEDLLENSSTFHTDVDRDLFDKMPLESASSSVSSLVTLGDPGNLGRLERSVSWHGRSRGKFFFRRRPADHRSAEQGVLQPDSARSIQSMEVIAGAPPAEYGDKTSVVINVTTRSGQGMTTPHGSLTASYGSFGTVQCRLQPRLRRQKWGNFISASGLNSGRFLDPPEFTVITTRATKKTYLIAWTSKLSKADSIHLNLGFTRSWFQTPNSFDTQNATAWSGLVVDNGGLGPDGLPVGSADQRSQIKTFNIAPSWTHLISSNYGLHAWGFRPPRPVQLLSEQTIRSPIWPRTSSRKLGQDRTLTNAGLRCRYFSRERHSQPESRRHVSADLS